MAATTTNVASAPTTAMRPRGRSEIGLSIVVPVFNEAGGLAALHARIGEIAARLQAARAARRRGRLCRRRQPRQHARRSPRALPADALDVQVVSLSRNFGKEAALLAGLDHARFGAVLFMDGDGQHPPTLVETLVGHWLDDGYDVVYTAKANRENEPCLRRLSACTAFYALINWGARHKIPEDAGDFRLLSPRAAAALRADAGAQPLLQRAGELDRLPPDARRLRAGRAQPRPDHLECVLADRPVDRRADLVLGRAAADRQPARPAARGRRADLRRADPDRDVRLRADRCPAIRRWSSA